MTSVKWGNQYPSLAIIRADLIKEEITSEYRLFSHQYGIYNTLSGENGKA